MITDNLRFLTYNILNGCHDQDRRLGLYAFIRQARADVVGLVEADGWAGQEQDIANELGYPFVSVPGVNDHYHKHPVLFSHIPILGRVYLTLDAKKCEYPQHRGALLADLQVQDKVLRTILCHLKHNSEAARIGEIDFLLSRINGVSNTVLMGDFNAFSPEGGYDQEYERTLEEFVQQSDGRHSYLLPRLQESRDVHNYATVRHILTHYKDAHPGLWRTYPTLIDHLESKRPSEKLDYIFTSPHLVLSNALVYRNDLTNFISDHYPLSVDLNVDSLH